MKNRVITLVIILILILLGIVIGITIPKENISVEDTKNNINELTSIEITQDRIEEIMDYKLNSSEIMIGEDSDLRKSLSDKLIKKYNLEEYKKRQKEYAKEVEEKYLSNFRYEIKKIEKTSDKETLYTIEMQGYYYQLYMADMTELALKLYKDAGNKEEEIDARDEANANFYKAKVKAMQLMREHLNNYINKNEVREFKVYFVDGKPKTRDDLITITLNFRGMTYENMNFTKKENEKAQKERIENYIEHGKTKKLLDENNLLKINWDVESN